MRALCRLIVLFAAALSLTGCLAAERHFDMTAAKTEPWAAVALFDASGRPTDPVGHDDRDTRPRSILALSGGGADGAFGAGVLVGWTETGQRPTFDIVTGVSTGALQAVFAFLGPAHDGALTDLYTKTKSHEVFTDRGVAGFLSDSVKDTEPLKRRIAQILSPAMIDEVASQHQKGRRLFVATTNLDSGTVTVWDMGRLAASNVPYRVELFREIMRASAAVPGFFNPVFIHPNGETTTGQMHVDGGVKAPILLRSFMLKGAKAPKTVYLLVNGTMRLRAGESLVSANLGGIAKKSITELLRGLLYKTIYQTYVVVTQSRARFQLAYIPDSVQETNNPLEFRPEEMGPLFEAGRKAVRSANFWQSEPPRLEDAERVTLSQTERK